MVGRSCIIPASSNSRNTNWVPPAAAKRFTSASPLGYTRASNGTVREIRSMSSQVRTMPAARATATQWMVWLVEPPVAISAAIALTMARSSIRWPIGR